MAERVVAFRSIRSRGELRQEAHLDPHAALAGRRRWIDLFDVNLVLLEDLGAILLDTEVA
jgi:hypothetical protein